ncbi:MAG TPA: hypothetical protein VG165_04445 [Solirubrobacteraceae bacterium]|jgi:hypothetical protein|nr:hypothetical protein [Solirubrobacteraceae bacterium]
MDTTHAGALVKVAGTGPALDGIVFDTPSRTKVVVAVVDSGRGPVFRTVHPNALTPRPDDGPHDPALRLLIKRTPPPARSADRSGPGASRRDAGHTRVAMHRTTGK